MRSSESVSSSGDYIRRMAVPGPQEAVKKSERCLRKAKLSGRSRRAWGMVLVFLRCEEASGRFAVSLQYRSIAAGRSTFSASPDPPQRPCSDRLHRAEETGKGKASCSPSWEMRHPANCPRQRSATLLLSRTTVNGVGPPDPSPSADAYSSAR